MPTRIAPIMLLPDSLTSFTRTIAPSPRLYPWLVALFYLAVHAQYWSLLPIDDGSYYYEILKKFTPAPLNLMAGSADHNAQLWMAVAGLPDFFFPGNVMVFNVWLSLLSAASVMATYAIIRILTAGLLEESDIALGTAVVAFHPSIMCNLVHFSPDTGIYLFMTFTLWALLKEQKWLAVACGCVLVFSKEQGVAYLGLLHAFCACLKPGWPDRWRFMLHNCASLLLPYALMLAYAWYKTQLLHQPFFFSNPHVYTGFESRSFLMYLLMGFVLNTNWLVSAIILAGAARMARANPSSPALRRHRACWLAYLGLFVSVLTVIMAVRHRCNLRYLLPLNFTLMLCFIYTLPAIRNPKTRHALLAAMAVMMLCQNVRTLDPVSLRVFCSTHLGTHPILHFAADNCLFGREVHLVKRDGYVYNMEYTKLTLIQEEIVRRFGPYNIYLGPNRYNLIPAVHRMDTLPEVFSSRRPPESFYLVELPSEALHLTSELKDAFTRNGPPQPVSVDGYTLNVQQFIRK